MVASQGTGPVVRGLCYRGNIVRKSTDVAVIHVGLISDFRFPFGGRLGFFGLRFRAGLGPKGPKPAQNRPRKSPSDPQNDDRPH